MDKIKKAFDEFKSVFITDDLLKENEEHANIVTATTMFNLFCLSVIVWALTYYHVFKAGIEVMNIVLVRSFIFLAIPAITCFILKGKGTWLKQLLFFCFTLLLAMVDSLLKNNVTLIMVIPVIMSARYYNKRFSVIITIITVTVFAISTWMSVNIGQQDISTYNLIIPEGTTITIESTLRDAVTQLSIDEPQRLRNIFLHFFLPKLMLFHIIAFACAQIAQSGRKMIEKQKEISKKGERIETELHLASSIQKNMLPSIFPPFPERKEIDLYAQMTPAKEVGGDFYDMFLIDDDHLAICMADVSGKGIPASLFMMISKILIKNVTSIEAEVNNAFTRVNKMLCDGNKVGLFVTCWLGVLDLRTGKMEYVNAGHNPPLLYSQRIGKFDYLRTKPNMVLAGLERTQYRKNEIQIEPGDRVFLYTDGVVEANDIHDKLYGEQRLMDFLNQHLSLDAEGTIKALKMDIDKFVGKAEQFDDITMLELIFRSRKGEENMETKQEFRASESELPNVQNFAHNALMKDNIDDKIIGQIDLVVEEIFVNIANYAYQNQEGACRLTVKNDNNKMVTLVFEDNGIPFNPLEVKDPNIKLSANERSIGGLGIFIAKKIMDHLEYRYENNKNILTAVKNV